MHVKLQQCAINNRGAIALWLPKFQLFFPSSAILISHNFVTDRWKLMKHTEYILKQNRNVRFSWCCIFRSC